MESKITIMVNPWDIRKSFEITIDEDKEWFLLSLRVLVNIIDEAKYYDEVNNLTHHIIEIKDKVSIPYLQRLASDKISHLEAKHKHYANYKAQINRKEHKAYSDLVSQVKQYHKEEHEDLQKKRNLKILDGFSVTISINDNLRFIEKNPSSKTHPLLSSLLDRSLKMFEVEIDSPII
jgi:Fe2+ transport system protein B